MRATGVFVQLVRPLFSIAHAFVENCLDIGYGRAFNDHEVLDEEAVLEVPARVQDTRGGIKEVAQLFVVDFGERGLHIKLFLSLSHDLPEVASSSRDDSLRLVLDVLFAGEALLYSGNAWIGKGGVRVGLARTGLAVGKDSGTVAVKGCVEELGNVALEEDILLGGSLVEDGIKAKRLDHASRGAVEVTSERPGTACPIWT